MSLIISYYACDRHPYLLLDLPWTFSRLQTSVFRMTVHFSSLSPFLTAYHHFSDLKVQYQAAQKSCIQHTSEIQETGNVLPHPQPGPLNLFYWKVLSFSSSYKSSVKVITLLALEKTKPCLANNVWTELEWEGSTVNKKYLSNAWETHSAAAGNKWACEDWAHLWLNIAYRVFLCLENKQGQHIISEHS